MNALGYGIVAPILYSYSQRYGLTDFQNGLLFSLYSICQFISTPIIGRLSDKFGRRPLLITSITGTAISFFIMAFAPGAFFLFLSRAIDGITAGNIPVAAAVISDSTDVKNRAKGFGIIGASFGFGFVFGPAISALTSGISLAMPFIIAGSIATVAALLTLFFLPETNTHKGLVQHKNLVDFKAIIGAIKDKDVGTLFLITLLYSLSFSMFTYVFQPFSLKVVHFTVREISYLFTGFGVIGLISQTLIVPKVTKLLGLKKTFSGAMSAVAIAFLVLFLIKSPIMFILVSLSLGLGNSLIMPVMNTILSTQTDQTSQGAVMGLNSSYMSIGQIVGPIAGGAIATLSISSPFLLASVAAAVCFWLTFRVVNDRKKIVI